MEFPSHIDSIVRMSNNNLTGFLREFHMLYEKKEYTLITIIYFLNQIGDKITFEFSTKVI